MRPILREDMKIGANVLTVQLPCDSFVKQFGPHHLDHPSGWDAPGPVELWFFELPWGLKVGLEYHLSISEFNVAVDRFENEAMLNYLDLGRHTHYWNFGSIELHKNAVPVLSEGLHPHSLYRLDDNGNTVLMRTYESRRVADYFQLVYEARGHRQLYWVEPG